MQGVNKYPHWDSNPDWTDFKSAASAGWAMGAKWGGEPRFIFARDGATVQIAVVYYLRLASQLLGGAVQRRPNSRRTG